MYNLVQRTIFLVGYIKNVKVFNRLKNFCFFCKPTIRRCINTLLSLSLFSFIIRKFMHIYLHIDNYERSQGTFSFTFKERKTLENNKSKKNRYFRAVEVTNIFLLANCTNI